MFNLKKSSTKTFKNKKLGFSLAEFLIGLVIISMIAVMAVPTMLETARQRKVEAKLRQTFNMLDTAALKASANEDANCNTSNYTAKNGTGFKNWWNGCIGRYLDASEILTYAYSSRSSNSGTNSTYGTVFLNNGIKLTGYVHSNGRVHLFICTNESENCLGDDFDGNESFLFTVQDLNDDRLTVYPDDYSYTQKSRTDLINTCKNGNAGASKTQRHGCTALVALDGWHFANDYPNFK